MGKYPDLEMEGDDIGEKFLNRAEKLFKSGHWTEALNNYRRAIEVRTCGDGKMLASMRQGNFNLRKSKRKVLTALCLMSSACYLELGDLGGAIQCAQQAVDSNSRYAKVRKLHRKIWSSHLFLCKLRAIIA